MVEPLLAVDRVSCWFGGLKAVDGASLTAPPDRITALIGPNGAGKTTLFSIISGFDAAYAEYNGFQSAIERYWTLQYLAQNGIAELDATVLKDGLVRADTLPLVFRTPGTEGLPRGARVRVRIVGTDLLTLDVFANLAARLDDQATPADTAAAEDAETEDAGAGPLTLAIDVQGDGAEVGETAGPSTT